MVIPGFLWKCGQNMSERLKVHGDGGIMYGSGGGDWMGQAIPRSFPRRAYARKN